MAKAAARNDARESRTAADLMRDLAVAFGRDAAAVYRAPGRVNLIGEHTDYNDGFVMPAAIDFFTTVAIAPRSDQRVRIRSQNFDETAEFSLDDRDARRLGKWSDYPRGVALALRNAGYAITGADMLIEGEVPIGSGLSSSAAIEVAVAYALADQAGQSIDRVQLALLCQSAENNFVGARTGIMDQFIAAHGRAGNALMLDCRSLEYRLLPLPNDVCLVIANTMVKHELASGEYNVRRAQCEEGVAKLRTVLPGIRALRDVTAAQLEQHRDLLLPLIYRRCRHVVHENERVLSAAAALEAGDLARFGELMRRSHDSLRDDYEVSCAELDIMVELAAAMDGVIGARMTGGGFGGCTINLVRSDVVEGVRSRLAQQYAQRTGREPDIYVARPSDGAMQIPV
jgi:galactokinase